ncbi:MAG: hypothetical protein K5695_13595 [Oscillospiraceae bacterium]|nr:hypothetical protein [Oscillospiraceae bacterium]
MKNMGKQIKELGVLLIVVGAGSLLLALFPLVSSDTQSPLYILADRYFVWLLVGGLVEMLVGIITRSIGKGKSKNKRDKQKP